MTGLGDRRHLLRPGINLDTHTDDIVNLIEMEDLNDIVLVGWSYGGMVVGNVLGRVPQRIASMVYLDAFVPDRGRSLVSYANRTGTPDGLIQQAMEGKDLALFPLDRMGITDKAVIDYCMPRLGPHPIATFLQASKAPAERPNIPHTYILAGANPGETFKIIHKRFVDEKAGDALVLNTSHATMLTDPVGTVKILKSVRVKTTRGPLCTIERAPGGAVSASAGLPPNQFDDTEETVHDLLENHPQGSHGGNTGPRGNGERRGIRSGLPLQAHQDPPGFWAGRDRRPGRSALCTEDVRASESACDRGQQAGREPDGRDPCFAELAC